MNLRHITRFTYTYTNFQGWRVAINRQGTTLARYFSDKQYGSEEEARDQAIRFRDMLVDELNRNPQSTREILDKYRVLPQNPYPAGLKPGNVKADKGQERADKKSAACSLRSNHVMQSILKNLCKRLQLDTASVLKLSLYMFVLQFNEQNARAEEMLKAQAAELTDTSIPADYLRQPEARLQRLVSELNQLATRAGFPSFEEFSTGKTRNRTTPADTCDTHNTSPPTQNPPTMTSHIPQEHVSPPRPSPPPHTPAKTNSAFLPPPLTRLSANPPLHVSPLQKMLLPIASESGHTRTIDHKPKRIALGSAPTNLPPPDHLI
ncbi:MAG: AP2 domain-containing protein [Akkermansia sp.]|nr:AP2 domain-containing protein [Akkermansia sp.]